MSKLHIPNWLKLLWRNPKSRLGIGILLFMVLTSLIAPYFAAHDPNAFSLEARESPSWHHLFGTTDQGSDVFAQVTVGAQRSLLLGFAAATLATTVATVVGVLAAYSGGVVDDALNSLINIFLVLPPIPLLIVVSGFLKSRGMWTMVLALGLVLWAFEARDPPQPGADVTQPRLRQRREGRRRVDTANHLRRADAEHDQPDRRCVRARLLHLAPHRRRPRVPRARQPAEAELGRDDVLGADQLRGAPGRVVGLRLPRRSRSR